MDGFLAKLYAELPLPQLVAKEKKYAHEIKSLDSEMQTLVYENYNKFISATDTIRKMKSQVSPLPLAFINTRTCARQCTRSC